MLYAAEYNPAELGRRSLTPPLSSLIAHMTTDDHEERASLADVLHVCEQNLGGRSSELICQQLAATVKLNSSAEGEFCQLYLSVLVNFARQLAHHELRQRGFEHQRIVLSPQALRFLCLDEKPRHRQGRAERIVEVNRVFRPTSFCCSALKVDSRQTHAWELVRLSVVLLPSLATLRQRLHNVTMSPQVDS